MKRFTLLALITALFTSQAFAAVKVQQFDFKMPTQQMIEHQSIVNPAAAGTTQVLSASAGATSAAAATVTTFVAQPDVPRNLVITPGGTTTDVEICNVTVTGTDILNHSISEVFAFVADQSTATTGVQAFKTVSSIAWAASCESGGFAATWSVGYGEKLGLDRCMDGNKVLFSNVGTTYETTRPTVGSDAAIVSKNTADFNGTMNGSNDFDIYFIQNFAATCQP